MKSIIPQTINASPDYYCTWQTQLYISNDGGPVAQRENITEENLFGDGAHQGWAYLHPDARRDLHIVLDDSWDVPPDGNKDYYGSLVLDKAKFPSLAVEGNPAESLKNLNSRIRECGWRSAGGWVCLQESPLFLNGRTPEQYWEERIMWADYAGIGYYKVDWGTKCGDFECRRLLTELSHKFAPHLCIEQAMLDKCVPLSDSFRTYDVPAIMSIPMTFEKLAHFLDFTVEKGYGGIVNCEDEVYIAAVLGCGMGVMRHSFVGTLPDGRPDPSFPSLHRNLKTKMAEVTRAARWHRLAPAFGVCAAETTVSDEKLTDVWKVENRAEEIEAWWKYVDGDVIEKSAPAGISRRTEIPKVDCIGNDGIKPFCAASKNPNGVYSLGVFGRTLDRKYITPSCHVTANIEDSRVIGIFGFTEKVTLKTDYDVSAARVIAQDIADENSVDITEKVSISKNEIVIPGLLISEIGTKMNGEHDTSEPGIAIEILA